MSATGVMRVAPTGNKASPNVRYAFNGDRICASQRTDAMCHTGCRHKTSAEIRALQKKGSEFLMQSHQVPDILLDFERGMGLGPIVSSSDEREEASRYSSLLAPSVCRKTCRARSDFVGSTKIRADIANIPSSTSLSGSGQSITDLNVLGKP